MRRAATGEDIEPEEATPEADEAAHTDLSLPEGRYVEMSAPPSSLCSLSPPRVMASASSSFEYRISGRGGKGIARYRSDDRNGKLVASIPGRGCGSDHAGDRQAGN